MDNKDRRSLATGGFLAFLAALTLLAAVGCRTRREIVLDKTDMIHTSFDLRQAPEELSLPEGEKASFVLWNRTRHQSQHVLQLAPDVALKERHHRRQDMTIIGIAGRAIVSVEGRRHLLRPGTAVFVPRIHRYTVIAHDSPETLIAFLVYSPPFDGADVRLQRQ